MTIINPNPRYEIGFDNSEEKTILNFIDLMDSLISSMEKRDCNVLYYDNYGYCYYDVGELYDLKSQIENIRNITEITNKDN